MDDDGEGEAAGDEYSIEGLVTWFGPYEVVLKMGLGRSSSELAVSTSRSNEDRNEGSPLVSMDGRTGLPAR